MIYAIFLQNDKDYDPFADRRRPTIAEKEDEYRQKRRRMIISPERVDPFADGEFVYFVFSNFVVTNYKMQKVFCDIFKVPFLLSGLY